MAPGVFQVELSDDHGHTYATLAASAADLLVLRYAPASTP
ncbi:MAG: hypothetical protein M3O34_16320 [Chloroflexota bacterium]|nr:hypothetical protein [Chloroflexota bacterium]